MLASTTYMRLDDVLTTSSESPNLESGLSRSNFYIPRVVNDRLVIGRKYVD